MITKPVYATREAVRAVIGASNTARNNEALDRALEGATEAVDACTRRTFAPWEGTRYFDWPNVRYPTTWRLWLEENELAAAPTSVASGGVTELYSGGNVYLHPQDGPPFTRLEISRTASFAFSGSAATQRSVAIVGIFGHSDRRRSGGTVAEALDASETEVQVTSGEAVGVGDLIRVDSERMLVTDRTWLSTGLTVQGSGLTNGASAVTLTASGSGLAAGELILVDSERMSVEDVSGSTVTVKRAQDGSVLAAHSVGATISAQRSLTVVRGAQGTTAATHLTSTAFEVQVYPGLVRQVCIAEALNTLVSESTAWARTIGSGEYAREATGAGLMTLRKTLRKAYGKMARTGAV